MTFQSCPQKCSTHTAISSVEPVRPMVVIFVSPKQQQNDCDSVNNCHVFAFFVGPPESQCAGMDLFHRTVPRG